MVCNSKSRLCVCEEGYKLDSTAVACTELSGAATTIPCRSQADCASYLSTVCSPSAGEQLYHVEVLKVDLRQKSFS